MKRLYLMRHGQAPGTAEAKVSKDALRPLSDKGRADAGRMAREILRRGGKPSLVLHSPLLRAVQTGGLAASELKASAEAFPALDNTRPPEEVLAALQARGAGVAELLAVGHQPQLGEIASLVAKAIFEMRPAGVVALELDPTPHVLWSLNVEELGA